MASPAGSEKRRKSVRVPSEEGREDPYYFSKNRAEKKAKVTRFSPGNPLRFIWLSVVFFIKHKMLVLR